MPPRTHHRTVRAIVVADARVRALVRTVDSLLRQSWPAEGVAIAALDGTPQAILQSLERRAQTTVARAPEMSRAVNTAVSSGDPDWVLLVPSGYRLDARASEQCLSRVEDESRIVVVAPAIREETPDGQHSRARACSDYQPVRLLEDPSAVPPVLFIRRSAWDKVGGLVSGCGVLTVCDLLIRLQEVGRAVGIADTLASCDVSDPLTWTRIWPAPENYLTSFARLIEKHRSALEPAMREVLIRREIGFGTLRADHRELVRCRDVDLQRLDVLRGDAAHVRAYLRHHGQDHIDWGDLRRTHPIGRNWGYERGVPIDRYYIEAFLGAHSSDIRGAVLEVQENDFTTKFGGSRVQSSSVVDLNESNPRATHLADLRCAPHIPTGSFDCIILTQTLHFIDDVDAVLSECRRLLRPDGVLLATLPCASRVCLEYGVDGDLWRMTPAGGRAVFEKAFGPAAVESTAYGNVLSNVAFLEGLACSDLTQEEFDIVDPYFPALVGIRARKGSESGGARSPGRAVLLYHRVADDEDVHGLALSRAALRRTREDARARLPGDFRSTSCCARQIATCRRAPSR